MQLSQCERFFDLLFVKKLRKDRTEINISTELSKRIHTYPQNGRTLQNANINSQHLPLPEVLPVPRVVRGLQAQASLF